jgi:hypothetical protein
VRTLALRGKITIINNRLIIYDASKLQSQEKLLKVLFTNLHFLLSETFSPLLHYLLFNHHF